LKAEPRLQELERENAELRLFRAAFDMTAEAMLVCDHHWRVLAVNPAFTAITGYLPDEIVGRSASGLYSTLGHGHFLDEVSDHLRRGSTWEGETWSRRKNGEAYRQSLSIACENNMHGGSDRHVVMFRDISEACDNAEKLWQHSNFDSLTGLPNRSLLLDRLLQALVLAGREHCRAAVLFVGLDGFKTINDTLGMTVGDMVLRECAHRFGRALRKGDTLGRFGGDEFIAVLPQVDKVEEVEAVVRDRSPPDLVVDIHRRVAVAGRRRGRGDAVAQRVLGPGTGQGGGARHLPLLHRQHGRPRPGPLAAGRRTVGRP